MHKAVISGTGLYTPPYSISNDELVESFNTFVRQYNDQHAEAIAKGELEALAESARRSSRRRPASRAAS